MSRRAASPHRQPGGRRQAGIRPRPRMTTLPDSSPRRSPPHSRDRGLDVRAPRADARRTTLAALARQAADEGDDVVVAGGDGTVRRWPRRSSAIATPRSASSAWAASTTSRAASAAGDPRRGARRHRQGPELGASTSAGSCATATTARPSSRRPAWGWTPSASSRSSWRAGAAGGARPARGCGAACGSGARRCGSPSTTGVPDADSPAVTVSNGPYHGMGFAVADDADPTDGLLDVAVFRGMSRWEVLAPLRWRSRGAGRGASRGSPSYPARRVSRSRDAPRAAGARRRRRASA